MDKILRKIMDEISSHSVSLSSQRPRVKIAYEKNLIDFKIENDYAFLQFEVIERILTGKFERIAKRGIEYRYKISSEEVHYEIDTMDWESREERRLY